MDPLTIIFLGSQGSGKGTQAKLLTEKLKNISDKSVFDFESGASFRALMNDTGYTAELVKKTLNNGEILPDFFPVWMWTDAFMKNLSHGEHIIIDGFPRTVTQAKLLGETFDFYERNNVYIMNLEIGPQVAEQRLLARGRSDDTPESIRKRLSWYESQVKPVIEYYKRDQKCKFVMVDGERSVDDVYRDIVKALNLE